MEFTDPFLMCVHHRHSFHKWDPFRAIQAKFFPEGTCVCRVVWWFWGDWLCFVLQGVMVCGRDA